MSKRKPKRKPPACPYCGAIAECVSSKEIYGRWYGWIWKCPNEACNAYVGCHGETKHPFGRLANKELRQWKMKAHAAFDPMWRQLGWKRSRAYEWLGNQLNIEKWRSDCHIGMFDVEQCKQVVEACDRYLAEVH